MLNRILKKLFGSSSNEQEPEETRNEFSSSAVTVFDSVAFLELGKLISNNDPDVLVILDLYVNDNEIYFGKYQDDLYQRSIETPEEIFPEIVLIDALFSKNKVVYIDHATEGHHVLTMLDSLVQNYLSKYECFKKLSEVYESKGRYNTIGNFIHNEKIGPMPFHCIKEAGYSLFAIDEGSDSYPFFLVNQENELDVKTKAHEAGIRINYPRI